MLVSLFKVVIYLLLFLCLFLFVIANGSGHNIPLKTNAAIVIPGLVLVLILFLLPGEKRKKDVSA